MDFDHKVGEERKQFASQVEEINEELFEVIKKGFTGQESVEFYEGLLAGYVCCYQMMKTLNKETQINLVGGIRAYISEIIEERN